MINVCWHWCEKDCRWWTKSLTQIYKSTSDKNSLSLSLSSQTAIQPKAHMGSLCLRALCYHVWHNTTPLQLPLYLPNPVHFTHLCLPAMTSHSTSTEYFSLNHHASWFPFLFFIFLSLTLIFFLSLSLTFLFFLSLSFPLFPFHFFWKGNNKVTTTYASCWCKRRHWRVN